MDALSIKRIGYIDGRRIVFWDALSRQRIRAVEVALEIILRPVLSKLCTHTKGHGGVKGTLNALHSGLPNFAFVARFDVASYYDAINHAILLNQLKQIPVPCHLLELVRQYLEIPDTGKTCRGLTAGGALSPLLAALYMLSLDKSFEHLCRGGGVFYHRYMDDIVILATTRSRLRKAIRLVYRKLDALRLQLHHKQKRFIGRTTKGFDFLGYRLHPGRKLRPAEKSVSRLQEHARRLYEHGADVTRLRRYVYKWWCWLWGGLERQVCRKGGWKRYWVWVKIRLGLGKDKQPGPGKPCPSGR